MRNITGVFIFIFCLFFGASLSEANTNQLIIINKGTNQLAFYENGKLISVHKVATGRSNSYTPEGTFKIVNKIKNRPYYTDNIPGGHPNNPLGDRWLGLDARGTYGTTYAIHGNNNPSSIGTYASAGCIRMYDDEVRWLFERVNLYTPVVITNTSKSFDSIAASKNYIPYSKLKAVTVSKESPQPENTTITVSAAATNNISSSYRFLVFDENEWKVLQDFSTSNKLNWKPTKEGSYKLKVQVKSKSSDQPFDDEKVIPYDIFVPALIQSVEVDKEGPLPIHTNVTITTETTNITNNEVKYSVYDGSDWITLQDYSNTTSLAWKPTKPGTYKISVQTKHKLSRNHFDDEKEISYTIFEPAAITSVNIDKVSPQPIHTNISITSQTNNDSTNLLKVLLYDGEKWLILQDYSTNTKATWEASRSGKYKIKVQAKHKLSKEEFDTERVLDYTVFEPAILQKIITNSKGIQQINGKIKIAAISKITQDTQYRFAILSGTKWEQVQDYSPSNELDWVPTKPGSYKIRIEIKNKLSQAEYDDAHEVPIIIYKTAATEAVLPATSQLNRNRTYIVRGYKRPKA